MRLLKRLWVPAFYWWSVWTSNGILWTIARWTVEGREHVPPGPLIVASNHLGNVDPMILAIAIRRRRLRFMAKAELFGSVLSPFVRSWDAFRVHRGASDRDAMRQAEAIVRNGEMLAMFPEGTRSKTGALGTLQRGTAAIALRTGAPILPCRLSGTDKLGKWGHLLPRQRVSARIGEPLTVERGEGPLGTQAAALTERLTEALEALEALAPEPAGQRSWMDSG